MEEKPGTYRLPNGNWMTPYGEQGESGFDIEQLRANLRLTPTERMEKAQKAIRFFEEVRRAGKRHRLSRNTRTAE